MREWWNEKDYLGVPGEQILVPEQSEDEVLALMMREIQHIP